MEADRTLMLLARSDLWSDRVRAGQGLSKYAGDAEVDAVLRSLLLGGGDTAVVADTAEALLKQGSRASWRVFAAAWALAGPVHMDHLAGALSGAFYEVSLVVPERPERLKADLVALMADNDAAVRDGARLLLERVMYAFP